jgi:hypothetical protein
MSFQTGKFGAILSLIIFALSGDTAKFRMNPKSQLRGSLAPAKS